MVVKLLVQLLPDFAEVWRVMRLDSIHLSMMSAAGSEHPWSLCRIALECIIGSDAE